MNQSNISATLRTGLSSKNGLVRKTCSKVLGVQKFALQSKFPDDYKRLPPIFANSFPKSGTHLLEQVLKSLSEDTYGLFLASLTSSFVYRRRPQHKELNILASVVPNELFKGHLFFSEACLSALIKHNIASYFIYRDPRDVIVSESYYLKYQNRWHRLHRPFAKTKNIHEAISLSINGISSDRFYYPNIRERLLDYIGWINDGYTLAIKYEDLYREDNERTLSRILNHYIGHSSVEIHADSTISKMKKSIMPGNSHTFRKGGSGGWRNELTSKQANTVENLLGDLLIDLGYEN